MRTLLRAACLLVPVAATLAPLISTTACTNGCEDATKAMHVSIQKVCNESAFANSPFCRCCVPNGFYSMDDTCTCKTLVLDSDFCFFEASESGYPSVRAALTHASSVCENRSVKVPYGDADAPICRFVPEAGAVADDTGDSDVGADPDASADVALALDGSDGG